jgi:4-hydroxy-tetrahydrodipicolinate reductase
MVRIAVNGAAGRMGRRLVALAAEDAQLQVAAALEQPGHPLLGQDAGTLAGATALGVPLSDRLGAGADVFIDFTVPAATRQALALCVEHRLAIIIGTTGLTPQDHAAIDQAARTIAVLQAPNMSLGVNLLLGLAAQVARQLGDEYDIEIVEAHHRFKKDAPSGTALGIAKAICAATGKSLERDVVHGRHGDNAPRTPGQIGMHALRLGDVVGDHTVSYATPGERLELSHQATNRDVFVRGALRAAKWLAEPGRVAGRYTMKDVLGL